MFQPLPTPFVSFQSSYGVANANIPDYTFAPTPLGQGGGSGGRANSGLGLPLGLPLGPSNLDANDGFASPASHHNSLLADNNHNHNHDHHPQHRLPPSSYNHHQQFHALPNHNTRHRHIKMEQPGDLAAQEAAARKYKPDLQGPMVGEKTPSHAITEEYAKADPTFVAKTLALPQTYSHYRPIQGDGNCGWRAIFFGYFECLVRCGDVNKVQLELERFRGELSNKIVEQGGYDITLFEDMIEETFELLQGIIQAMTTGQDPMVILLHKFNDEASSAPMIYHLRLLAASCLKERIEEYGPFVQGVSPDVNSYCDAWIMPVDREIDHLGIILLYRTLLEDAFREPHSNRDLPNSDGIVLEIAYLDRSEGDKVNVHRMPENTTGKDPAVLKRPMINLLYRPGHYDILYRDAPPAPTGPISLQVNRVSSFTHHYETQHTVPSLHEFSTMDMGALAMIPGFAPSTLSPLASSAATTPLTDGYSPSPQSPWMPHPYIADGLPASQPTPPQPSPPQQQPIQQQHIHQQLVGPAPIKITTHPLRFSKYNFPGLPEMVDASAYSEPTFTTNTFKNSHFNVAHYNNPHFQPEEYKPDDDEEIPTGKIGGRKRSREHCGGIKKGL